ncbi:Auxilin-like protein and related proteins containing DnaJ domain [Handroanthus impetiginosus]|uniref:Auxilin-like protein and related proteins containing DnaJ domain n=1 Tax=Handroanthus impetiginosus TaxID=429701 RepID=A0A2G9HW12_9LAMI|nr:Auxilin-like protein and related proteins containing DnaJ domain [Handroanthus impetiginosus]
MESLSRPPHRRKHSTTTTKAFSSTSFSLKNPYDDIVFSKGGGKTKFGAHEYAEIFSGSSSIPVLDLSCLDERVGSGDGQSSKLDYSNIFGGLRDDDVGVPYEELFNGAGAGAGAAAKKTKTRIPADAQVPTQESGSINSPEKTKQSSDEALDQSIDEVKKHFNVSFNKINQRNIDASNGETHIAQLHAVPGFTYFVDGAPRSKKTEVGGRMSSLKREVSRTWSFSAGVEVDTVNAGPSSEKSNVPDKSHNVNEINLKSHISKVLSSSSNVTDSKDLQQSKLPSFASKDASEKTAGESSPPLSDEELDENSVAAVSAAALKKAIEQAQESIRIAKMIMERKRESFQDGSKPPSKSHMKGKDKGEIRIDHEADGLKEINARETYERLDPKFAGLDGKFAQTLGRKEKFLNARNSEVGTVGKNVEAAIEHGDAFMDVDEKFASSSEKVELENIGQNVEAAEACTTNFTVSYPEEMENAKETPEQKKESIHQPQGPEVVSEPAERAPETSQRVQELDKSMDEAMEQFQATGEHVREPENIAEVLENVPSCSRGLEEHESIIPEAGESLRISQEDEMIEERNNVDNDNCDKKFVEHEDMVYGEPLTVLKQEFDNLPNDLRSQAEKDVPELEDMEKKYENVPEMEENDHIHGKGHDEEENGMRQEEVHQWFESEEQLKEPLEEEISDREPEIFTEVEEVGTKLNVVHKPEIDDKKLTYGHDADEQKVPTEFEQNEDAERRMDSSEFEVAESVQMEANNCVGETNDTLTEEGRIEENQDKFDFQEAASEKDTGNEVVACSNDSDAIYNEAQESRDDLNNKADEYKEDANGYKEEDSLPGETETYSAVEDKEAVKLFDLEVDEMPETDSLRRSASEENFIGSKLNDAFEGISADIDTENIGLMDADDEELRKDRRTFETASEIHAAGGEYDAKSDMQTSYEADPSNNREFDETNVRLLLGRTSESNDGSVSISILENIDGVSALESQRCAENAKDKTSNEEEGKDNVDVTSDEREYVEEQSERVSSEDQNEVVYHQSKSEHQEMDNSMETESEVKTGQNMNEEDLGGGTSTVEQKDAKGNEQKFDTNDQQQRIEAIKRGREREKDRIAVERAIREARERAFAEARERAERAAVERAAAEARQRVIAEAREKHEKASVETKPSANKSSTEAKLRAERAAVERATAEARERALEKAMSQKNFTEAKTQAERNNGLKHSFSSSDLDKFDGTLSESAQRRKARLERHQRIMERAAKALAEKNMRDLLAQKEQAERNRLAESLDADIKRWANGKEGNLRALLSTLQYILGPESGWQPVSLTEIITTAAVKKAYRKATLCVHPDKLQQRGASIQQKYICEKVFDLLKAAWNRFNSEER